MRSALLGALVLTAGALSLPASPSSPHPLPRDWHVTTENATGKLHIGSIDGERVEATLLGVEATGWIVGDMLVLRRPTTTLTELWQARLGRNHDGEAFLAGTVTAGSRIHPFFAVSEEPSTSELIPPAERTEAAPSVAPAPTPDIPTDPLPPTPLAAVGFAGWWLAPTGRVEVRRDGSEIEVTMPDGTIHSGRMTGETTFVVGLRVACCKGKLEGPDTVRWEDGTAWRRAH